MELTQEQIESAEAIKDNISCPRGFECQKLGFANWPKVKRIGALLECLEETARECPFSFSFGFGHLCRCPLNRYIHRLKKEQTEALL